MSAPPIPPPPRGPTQLARAAYYGFRGSDYIGVLSGAFICLLAVVFSVIWAGPALAEGALDLFGETTRGVLTKVQPKRDSEGYSWVEVEFRYKADGREVSGGSWTAKSASFSRVPPGTRINVEYFPLAPAIARAHGTKIHDGFWPWTLVWIPALAFFGMLVVLLPVRNRLRIQSIYRKGEATWGQFRSFENEGSEANMYVLRYAYQVNGREYESFVSNSNSNVLSPLARAQLVVLYDPKKPKRSVPYA